MAEMVLMKAEQSLKRTETGHIWSLKTEKQPLWTLKVNSTFSQIRTRRWNIRGVRGEINDNIVRFLNDCNQPVEQRL